MTSRVSLFVTIPLAETFRLCGNAGALRSPLALALILGGPLFVPAAACGSSGGTHPPPSSSSSGGADASSDAYLGDATSGSSSGGSGSGGGSGSSSGSGGDSGHPSDSGQGSDSSIGVDTPIKHVVVVVKENHTFDNYFSTFPGAEGSTQCQTTSGPITAPHATNTTTRDLCHEHSCALQDLNGGKMDGWLSVTGASMGGDNLFCAQYLEADLPNYWAYARKYALADHFFANVLGPSFPGHTFVLAAQAGWATGNPPTYVTQLNPWWGCDQPSTAAVDTLDHGTCTTASVFPCFDIPSVPTLLPPGVGWKFYGTNFYLLPEQWSMFDAIKPIRQTSLWNNVVNVSQFTTDVQAGTLPAVTWLVDQDFNDEHPNIGGVCEGENWTVGYINLLMQSPLWKDTVVFFTMDDFGGWYDHVKPPRQYGCDATSPYGLGFRLPLIVMSPYVKPGVYKNVAEQASIVKFILEVFKAPKYLADLDPAAQDKQANDMMDMFDWNQTPLDPLVLTPRATCPP